MLVASADLQNEDFDNFAIASCSIPGDSGSVYLAEGVVDGVVSMTSVVDHAGGSVNVDCSESGSNNLTVEEVSLTASKVNAIN